MRDVKVDIVVPIYNAFEFTKKCIETVIDNTDLKRHTLVLINDKSSDEKILPMLKEVVESHRELNIKLIDNEENQGFVKSVNIGMSNSKNDVVLLNSDTEVTKNWLVKIIETAYSASNVATVTPLSNNATLASIPNFLEENTLPDYISLEEYSKTVEEASFNAYPELTTANGFCMYIRRDAIEKVGLFDVENFGKGYGEENEFSYRCINHGLVNLLCDNTFIYHKGTQSFTGEKAELSKAHWEYLKENYPKNIEMNDDLCIKNPYSYVQDIVKYSLGNKYRKNMLIVAHEFFDLKAKLVGGTVEHIYDLVSNVRKDINCHVFYFKDGKYMIKSFFENSTADMVIGSVVSYENLRTYNNQYRKILEKVFRVLNIDFVHVHHMLRHYFDLLDILEEKKMPYIVSLHDYYLACPSILMLENGEKLCVDNPNCDCKSCLNKLINIDCNLLSEWRALGHRLLKGAKVVIAPSRSAKENYQKYFKDIDIKVIEHGMNKEEFLKASEIPERANDRKNIAFLGGLNISKGLNYMKYLVEKVNSDELPYTIHLFGQAIEWEVNRSTGNYVFHDTYNRNEIVKILKENNIDLILLLTICPETFCYTLTESSLAEIPVIALSCGALEERVKKNGIGWLLPKDASNEAVVEKIKEAFENKEEYEQIVNNMKKYNSNLRTIPDMAKDYADIYKQFTKLDNTDHSDEIRDILLSTKTIFAQENEIDELVGRVRDYHYTVFAYKDEIERLNESVGALTTERALQDCELDRTHGIEREYIEYKNRLEGSRKMRLLRKIKFIDY